MWWIPGSGSTFCVGDRIDCCVRGLELLLVQADVVPDVVLVPCRDGDLLLHLLAVPRLAAAPHLRGSCANRTQLRLVRLEMKAVRTHEKSDDTVPV